MRKQLTSALYILRHPFDGFWEMKYANRGNLVTALILTVLYFAVIIIDHQARNFMFNSAYGQALDLVYQLRIFLLPLIIFVAANWSITTLLDGKGSLKEIVMMVGYSLQPLIIFQLVSTVLTHFLSLNELAYLNIFELVGYIWFAIMIFIGLMQIHEYTFFKAIVTLIFTAISAMIIAFICLLFFSLIQEISGFIYSIYREVSLRMYS